jgi:hypothetical protein
MLMDKLYLGDGVYAEWRDNQLILTTEDGISVSNTIYLDVYVLDALITALKRAKVLRE